MLNDRSLLQRNDIGHVLIYLNIIFDFVAHLSFMGIYVLI